MTVRIIEIIYRRSDKNNVGDILKIIQNGGQTNSKMKYTVAVNIDIGR
jgi:hypothetical protein